MRRASDTIARTVDQVDKLSEKHGDEVNKLLTDAYKEVAEAMSKGGDGLGDKVVEIMQRTLQVRPCLFVLLYETEL